ncbi:LysR family transcriptional regulator [Cytobacillus depressus]|uniref:LysR family transcriptional regulator n=1 Tax=Cytobacillus depressus TaxID=1602942 RepID=A0A6L3VB07_9BACI|nr:LysR family transcriptional regulator [Cytobacillus depressus]KAB2336298.1 LysR family transcriptional regulator [Cytobacillus depressus]
MSIPKYEVFNTVIELGSLTKAAEALNLTQSAISYSISNLETELGFPLLTRNRSGISLTSNGKRILKYVRTILHWDEKMKQEAASIKGIEVGTIRIGAFTSVCTQWLPGIMKKFKEEHPAIEIKILQGGYEDIEHWIRNGSVDFGFVTLPTDKSFDIISLAKDRMLCILAKNHPLSVQDKIQIEQLVKEPFIIPKSGYDNDLTRIFKDIHSSFNIKFEMADDQAIIAMVENELGISIIPELVLHGHPHNVSIHELEQEKFRNIGIASTSLKELSPAAVKFITTIKNAIGSSKLI